MPPGLGLVVATGRNADHAIGPFVFPCQSVFVTAIDVNPVALDAVVYFLAAEGDAVRRTSTGALHAIFAHLFDPDIDRLIDGQGKIRCHYGQMYPRAVVFMDQHAMTAKLAQAGIHRERDRVHLAAGVIVGTSWITHFPDVGGQHEGSGNHPLVAEPILGIGNAAVVTEKFFIIAGETHTDGIAVWNRDGITWFFSGSGIGTGAV